MTPTNPSPQEGSIKTPKLARKNLSEAVRQGKATLFIQHFSYTRLTQSASHINIVLQ